MAGCCWGRRKRVGLVGGARLFVASFTDVAFFARHYTAAGAGAPVAVPPLGEAGWGKNMGR